MMSLLGDIARRYQDEEDERLYGGGPSGGRPFIFGSHPDNRPQRNELADMLTGKKKRRKEQEKKLARKAGKALRDYLGIG